MCFSLKSFGQENFFSVFNVTSFLSILVLKRFNKTVGVLYSNIYRDTCKLVV